MSRLNWYNKNMEGVPKNESLPEPIIADADPEDALAYRELERDVWQQTYANEKTGITKEDIDWYFNTFKHAFSAEMIENFKEVLASLDESEKAIVVKSDKQVIGTAWLIRSDEYNELGSIYVHPDFQRQAVGKRIWETALQYFDKSKPTVVTVNKHNESAIRYYESLGFVQSSTLMPELRFPSGALYEEVRMVRPPEAI